MTLLMTDLVAETPWRVGRFDVETAGDRAVVTMAGCCGRVVVDSLPLSELDVLDGGNVRSVLAAAYDRAAREMTVTRVNGAEDGWRISAPGRDGRIHTLEFIRAAAGEGCVTEVFFDRTREHAQQDLGVYISPEDRFCPKLEV